MKLPHALAILVLFALAPIFAHAAPAITISLTPSTGVAPYTASLTWSVTGATGCTGSDAWTGTKALTGTQSVTITAAAKYTLTCTAADGQTTTVWTPPTTNTDGTPFTDNTGYNVYRGTTTTNLAKLKWLPGASVTSYTDSALASGNYYYAVTAVGTAGGESVQGKANPYPIAVSGSQVSASASAGIQSPPNPPSGVITTTVSTTTTTTVTTGTP